MNIYYYITRMKPRGQSPRYVGDGVIEAENAQDAKEIVATIYGTPVSRVEVEFQSKLDKSEISNTVKT